jgi:hypothetical protein
LGVVPIAIDVQSVLDCVGSKAEECPSLPEFGGAEESLDFSIETGEAHASFDRGNTEAILQAVAKSLAELTAVIGDEEAGQAVDLDGTAGENLVGRCSSKLSVAWADRYSLKTQQAAFP